MASQIASTPRPSLTGRSTGTSRASRVPPVNFGVRLLVALNISYMAHLGPLMIQRFVRFVGTSSFGTRALVVSQGTDLTGFAGHNLVARPSLNLAVCPLVACSPPLSAKMPHAIASSRAVLRRPRFTIRSLQANAQTITAYCLAKVTLNIQATAGHCLQQIRCTMFSSKSRGRLCGSRSNSRHGQAGSNPLPLRAPASQETHAKSLSRNNNFLAPG